MAQVFDPFKDPPPEKGGIVDPYAKGYEAPTIGGEFKKGVSAGIDNTIASGYGLAGLVGDAVGADKVRDWGYEGYKRNNDAADEDAPAIGRIEDIGSVKDAALWASSGLGQLAPFMATSALSGGVGAGVAQVAVRKGLQKGAEKAIAAGIEPALVRTALKDAASTAAERGATAGAAANSIGVEQGGIYGDIKDKTGENRPGVAAMYGVGAGLLDVLPEARLFHKIAKGGKGGSLAGEVAKQFALEGSTEAAQTAVENSAVAHVDPKQEVFTPEGWSQIRNAGAIGALGGVVGGGGTHIYNKFRNGKNVVDADVASDTAPPLPTTKDVPLLALEDKRVFTVAPDGSTWTNQEAFQDAWAKAAPEQRAAWMGREAVPPVPANAISEDEANGAVDRMSNEAKSDLQSTRDYRPPKIPFDAMNEAQLMGSLYRQSKLDEDKERRLDDPQALAELTQQFAKPKLPESGPLSRVANIGIDSGVTSLAPAAPGDVKNRRSPVVLDEKGKVIGLAPEHVPWMGQAKTPEDRDHALLALQAHAKDPQTVEAALAAPDVSSADERTMFKRIINGQGIKNDRIDQKVTELRKGQAATAAAAGEPGGPAAKRVDSERPAASAAGDTTAATSGGVDHGKGKAGVQTVQEGSTADAGGPGDRAGASPAAADAGRAGTSVQEKGPAVREEEGEGSARGVTETKGALSETKAPKSETKAGKTGAGEKAAGGRPPSKAQRQAAEKRATIEAHFTPGNIVKSYGGVDRVLGFNWNNGEWRARVVEVKSRDGKWEVTGRPREHATFPGKGNEVIQRAPERRADTETRKKVEQMSPEEMRTALLTDDLTGLGNARKLAEDLPNYPHVVAFDADSLKWVNDNMGHESGDLMLKAWGEALKAATDQAYRKSGDEFFALAKNPAEAEDVLERVRAHLSTAIIEAETPEGKITLTGLGVSHGIGKDPKTADTALNAAKRAREKLGQRAGRGEEPPGVARAAAEGKQDHGDQTANARKNDQVEARDTAAEPAEKRTEKGAAATPSQVDNVREWTKDARASLAVDVLIAATVAKAESATGLTLAKNTAGLAYRGRIVLVAERLHSALDAQKAIFHEVFHVALRGKFGRDIAGYEKALSAIADVNASVRKRAEMWRTSFGKDAEADFRSRGMDETAAQRATSFLAIEEALADLSGEHGARVKLKGLREFIAAVQKLMRKLKLTVVADWMEKIGNAEALSFIAATRERVQHQEQRSAAIAAQPAFMRSNKEDERILARAVNRMNELVTMWENGKLKETDSTSLGETPRALQLVGAPAKPLYMSGKVLAKVFSPSKHGQQLTPAMVRQIPAQLLEPSMIFKSDTQAEHGALVVVTELVDRTGNPVVVPIHINVREGRVEANRVASIYGRQRGMEKLEEWARRGLLLYADKSKTAAPSTTSQLSPGTAKPGGFFQVVQLGAAANPSLRTDADVVNRWGAMFSRGAPVWYSELARQVAGARTASAPAPQWKGFINGLKGVKADEIEWSGVRDWLDLQKGPVTRDQVLNFLGNNGVRVEETMLGEKETGSAKQATSEMDRVRVELDALGYDLDTDDYQNLALEVRKRGTDEVYGALDHGERTEPGFKSFDDLPENVQALINRWDAAASYGRDDIGNHQSGSTKFSQYTLPGGENYRELLLTLPQKIGPEDERLAAARALNSRLIDKYGGLSAAFDKWTSGEKAEFDRVHADAERAPPTLAESGFRSSHFDQANILAHVRFDERTDAEGKKVLFIEELQSDWAQKGKRAGFQPKNLPRTKDGVAREVYGKAYADLDAHTQSAVDAELDARLKPPDRGAAGPGAVPSAPFVGKTEAWVALAVKRMIRYAAEHGFDRVAFTTGEQQAARYDLSKHVDAVRANLNADGTYQVGVRPTGKEMQFLDENVPANRLADMVGKDLADKITQQVREPGVDNGKVFRDLDLKVGGEGMKSFYDKIVPNVVNDVLKKLGGGRVGEVTIPGELKARKNDVAVREDLAQPGFDISPAMRQTALDGMPVFSRAAAFEAAPMVDRFRTEAANLWNTPKTFNIFHRTVGTQQHKAAVDADYGRVFKHGQAYLQDVAQIANDPADLAPSVLPQIRSLKDALTFARGASKADLEKISSAVFNGTLENVVFDDAALRGRFKLNDAQVAQYKEVRAAVDRSLDQLATSEAARLARKENLGNALEAARNTPEHGPEIVRNALAQQAQALDAAGDKKGAQAKRAIAGDLLAKIAKIKELKANGYAPLQRFGQYTVYVTRNDGKDQVYFGMYESKRAANMARAALGKEFPDAQVTQGILSTEAYKLFHGMTPDTLELFGNVVTVGPDGQKVKLAETELFQQYLKLAVNNRSAMKRLIQRKGVAGFSEDVSRVLAQFITSNARAASGNYHFADMLDAVNAIPKEKGDVKDEAVKLTRYLQDPQEEASTLRGFLFIQYLGGSIASALTNMTQPVLMSFPYLAQWGTTRAAAALTDAGLIASGARKIPIAETELRSAMARAVQDGVIAPQEIHQLQAEAMRGFGSNIHLRKGLALWGSFFSLAEQFNRRATFIAAYRIAKAEKMADPFTFAEDAVKETQGIYNRGNRPNWARGAIGATLFTFKQFSIAYLEFVKRLPPKQQALALGVLVLAAGTQGLPFADDLDDMIDTIAQALGYSWNTKQQKRELLARTFGEGFGGFLMFGGSALPGVPLDVQGRLGLGNLIPGSGLFKKSEVDKTKDLTEALGPIGGFAQSLAQGAAKLQQGDLKGAMGTAAPLAVQNALKALEMAQMGMYRDQKGRRVMNTDDYDAFIKAVGFQPSKVAAESRKMQESQQNVALARATEGEISDKWAQGIFEKDRAKIDDAISELKAWNKTNPESPIAIHQAQIQRRVKDMAATRESRAVKAAPKEMRGTVVKELR